MTQEQKDRALACIRGAEELGRLLLFDNGVPCCALGHLLFCAGITQEDCDKARINLPLKRLTDRHPILGKTYGLDFLKCLDIMETNDRAKEETPRAAVLALIESWEVEDAPAN